MADDKAVWSPPGARADDRAPLGCDDLEYLERLVAMGEGLLMEGLVFCQAEMLLRHGYAQVKREYAIGGRALRLIEPSERGRSLAAERARLLAERCARPLVECRRAGGCGFARDQCAEAGKCLAATAAAHPDICLGCPRCYGEPIGGRDG